MAKWRIASGVSFREIEPGLICMSSPGTRQMSRYGYLLLRPRNNILVHGPDVPAFYDEYREQLESYGGIQLQLLTHKDEASAGSVRAWKIWQAPIKAHALDQTQIGKRSKGVALQCFEEEHRFAGLEALWLPGHSAGFAGYKWKGREGIYLFGGDLMVPSPGGWSGAGDLDWYRWSLGRICRLKLDYLLPNKGRSDLAPPIAFDRATRRAVADEVLGVIAERHARRAKRGARARG